MSKGATVKEMLNTQRFGAARITGPASTMAILAAALTFAAAGCSSLPKGRSWSPDEQGSPPKEMRLAPGDEIEVRFFGAPELNVVQQVRRDGNITLQLVGDVKVAGFTPSELQSSLTAAYKDQLQITEVSVVIQSPAPVYIHGAVLEPGPVHLVRPLTALEAIMEGGGFVVTQAEIDSVIVIRQVGKDYHAYALSFEGIMEGGKQAKPFYLQPYDIVHVPRTRIVQANQWVEQYISRMIPRLPFAVSSDGTVSAFFY